MEDCGNEYVVGVLTPKTDSVIITPLWKVIQSYAYQRGISIKLSTNEICLWLTKPNKNEWVRKLTLKDENGAIIGYLTPSFYSVKNHYPVRG